MSNNVSQCFGIFLAFEVNYVNVHNIKIKPINPYNKSQCMKYAPVLFPRRITFKRTNLYERLTGRVMK